MPSGVEGYFYGCTLLWGGDMTLMHGGVGLECKSDFPDYLSQRLLAFNQLLNKAEVTPRYNLLDTGFPYTRAGYWKVMVDDVFGQMMQVPTVWGSVGGNLDLRPVALDSRFWGENDFSIPRDGPGNIAPESWKNVFGFLSPDEFREICIKDRLNRLLCNHLACSLQETDRVKSKYPGLITGKNILVSVFGGVVEIYEYSIVRNRIWLVRDNTIFREPMTIMSSVRLGGFQTGGLFGEGPRIWNMGSLDGQSLLNMGGERGSTSAGVVESGGMSAPLDDSRVVSSRRARNRDTASSVTHYKCYRDRNNLACKKSRDKKRRDRRDELAQLNESHHSLRSQIERLQRKVRSLESAHT